MPNFDKPATVSWSTPGPGGGAFASRREFATLREALLYARRLPHGARARATVRCGRRSYDAAAVEELAREMRGR